MLYGDYHTHTVYSHGKTSIEENVKVAESLGIKQIAITDHGFGHMAMGVKRRNVPKMKREIADCNEKYSVHTYMGIEANIISREGDIDLKPHEWDWLDIVICGYHKGVWGKTHKEFWQFIARNNLNNWFRQERCFDYIEEYTGVMIKTIKKNKIDVLTHVNHDIYVDPVEVAKCARDYGTYIELNSKRQHVTDEQLYNVAKTGVQFVLSSDAHHARRVGDVDLAMTQVERVGIGTAQIANWDRIPNFRSRDRG